MRSLIGFVLNQRLLVLAMTMLLVGVGIWSALALPIDAVPDVTNVQVQINTNAAALPPSEVERQVTLPVELAMFGLPDLEEIRSISKFGLSQVTVVFEEGTDIYFARQQVQERLAAGSRGDSRRLRNTPRWVPSRADSARCFSTLSRSGLRCTGVRRDGAKDACRTGSWRHSCAP
jgi:hypothetical protein